MGYLEGLPKDLGKGWACQEGVDDRTTRESRVSEGQEDRRKLRPHAGAMEEAQILSFFSRPLSTISTLRSPRVVPGACPVPEPGAQACLGSSGSHV